MNTTTLETLDKRSSDFRLFAEKFAKKAQNAQICADDVYRATAARYLDNLLRLERTGGDVAREPASAEALAAIRAIEETAAAYASIINSSAEEAANAANGTATGVRYPLAAEGEGEIPPTREEIVEQLQFERENLDAFQKKANGAKKVNRIINSGDANEVAAVALALSWHGADIKRAFRLARRGCPLLKGSADFAIMKRGDHRGATCKKIANDELEALEFESAMEYALKTPLGKKIVLFVETLPPSMRELVKLRLCDTKIKDCAAAFGRGRVAISKLKKKLINYALEAGLEPRAAVEKKHYTPILGLGPREDDEWIIDLIADEDKTFFGNNKLGFDAENEK